MLLVVVGQIGDSLMPTPESTLRPDSSLTDGVNSIVQLLTLVFIFVFVLAIAVIATRWIVKYQRGAAVATINDASRVTNIEIVETYRLTIDKYVQIIRVGERYLAIAIGKNEVSLLTELSQDELHFVTENPNAMIDFAGLFTKFKNSFGDKNKNETTK